MVNLISNKRCGPIGLELGAGWVNLIQFSADQQRVIDAVRWDLPEPTESQTAESRGKVYARAIREAREGRRFRGHEVAVSLSAGDLFVQNIRVVKGPASELAKLIQQEAAARLPYPALEAEIRYLCAGDVRQGDQTKREVILLACHQSTVENTLSIVERAGLQTVAVETEPSALLRCYARQFRREGDKDQRAMIVRLSASNTTVVIAQGSEVFLVKYIDVGGDQLDEAVARHLGVDVAEAGALRRHNGERRADQQDPDLVRSVNEATRPVIEKLLGELSLCIRYHSVTFRGQPLTRIVVGGPEATPHVVGVLGARLDVKCELGDPLRSVDSPMPAARRGAWDVATGLALRGLN